MCMLLMNNVAIRETMKLMLNDHISVAFTPNDYLFTVSATGDSDIGEKESSSATTLSCSCWYTYFTI